MVELAHPKWPRRYFTELPLLAISIRLINKNNLNKINFKYKGIMVFHEYYLVIIECYNFFHFIFSQSYQLISLLIVTVSENVYFILNMVFIL